MTGIYREFHWISSETSHVYLDSTLDDGITFMYSVITGNESDLDMIPKVKQVFKMNKPDFIYEKKKCRQFDALWNSMLIVCLLTLIEAQIQKWKNKEINCIVYLKL